MLAVRPKVDDLPLMTAKDGMAFGRENHCQMRKRSKAAIGEEDVALAHFGNHARGVGHVMRAHRREDRALQKADAGMKQGEHVSDGKAATGFLAARLSEVLLQFGFVGHGEAGTVES